MKEKAIERKRVKNRKTKRYKHRKTVRKKDRTTKSRKTDRLIEPDLPNVPKLLAYCCYLVIGISLS
jgi:hypothetical protein